MAGKAANPERDEKEITLRLGRNLRALRLGAGFSMADLSRHLAVSYQQIQKYEQGTNRLPVEKLYVLKRLYGVPYESFFGAIRDIPPDLDSAIHDKISKIRDAGLKTRIWKIIGVLTAVEH